MHVFLAGATGVLGRRIVPLLVDRGHRVTAITRRPDRLDPLRAAGATAVVTDVMDARATTRAVANAAPDLIMHQLTDLSSGSTSSNATLRKRGTRSLVDAARAAGVERFVAQSIAWAYAPGLDPADERVPLDREAPEPRRTSIDGIVALETAVAEMPQWVVLRYGMLYGAGTWYAPSGSRADEARLGALPPDGNITSFVHVEDAANAAVEAMAWTTGFVNICDDEPVAGYEWVPQFCSAVGARLPDPRSQEAVRAPWARGADNGLARNELGWQPRWPSWRDGFAAMALDGSVG